MTTTYYRWTEKLAVHIEELDEHHKHMIHLINRLKHSIKNNSPKPIAHEILIKLVEYTKYHFSAEEKYMRLHNYPDYSNHLQQHRQFIEKVFDFFQKLQAGKESISEDILGFLTNWLFTHIRGVDTKLGLFINHTDQCVFGNPV